MTEGPSVRISASCADCRYCVSKSETFEDGNDSDTSWDVNCVYGGTPKHIGSNWTTPKWCAFLDSKIKEKLAGLGWAE